MITTALLLALCGACSRQPDDFRSPGQSRASAEAGATPRPPTRPNSGARHTYRNPVFAHDAPDPGVLRAPDGTYYAYTTQSIYLDVVEIPILRSTDLVRWRQVGDAFPQPPDWVLGGPAGDMWAPQPVFWKGRYLLYYAARRIADGSMAIGVATARSPVGPFRDLGHPVLTRSAGQPTYTAIDPFVLADHGRLRLYWGSDNQPIRVQRLDGTGTRTVGRPTALIGPVLRRGGYGGLVEGPWIQPHEHWYYLFYSVGDCCSEKADYSVFVARSRRPDGPFHPGPDNPILHQNAHFWAVGHNATAVDERGTDWIIYHARDRSSFSDDRLLMLDRIVWEKGWPTVNNGAGPSWTRRRAPQTTRP